jgi:hypothetical protein
MPLTSKWAGWVATGVACMAMLSSRVESSVVSEVAAGVSVSQPLGLAGDTFNRPAGAFAEAWFRFPDFLPENLEVFLTSQYIQYAVQNVGGTNGVQINVGTFGLYTGATVWGGPSVLGIRPMLGGGLGLLYSFMTFPGAAGWTSNAGTSFALRLEPGVDVPISGRLGVLIEFPMTLAFQKPNNFAFWESSFALRWKL